MGNSSRPKGHVFSSVGRDQCVGLVFEMGAMSLNVVDLPMMCFGMLKVEVLMANKSKSRLQIPNYHLATSAVVVTPANPDGNKATRMRLGFSC